MNKIKQFLAIIDEQIIFWLASFLIVFIPLYPKIPLFSPIEQYIVRVRWEDVAILFTVIIWGIWWLRKKITVNARFAKIIGLYLLFSFLSVVSGIFLTKTIPMETIHIGKSMLHFFRYLEYFTLFFILYSAIKNKKDVIKLLGILSATLFAVTVYGLGQRYLYWPVFSTMNREFSKGIRLYLTEHARVQSTFAGHYDLGAWLVVVLPLIFALALNVKNKIIKLALHLLHLGGLWLLVESAARSSFAGYIIGAEIVIILFAINKTQFLSKVWYFFSRSAFLGISVLLTMIYFGDSMIERLVQAIEPIPILSQAYKTFDQTFGRLPTLFPTADKPTDGISTDDAVKILVSSDERPVTDNPKDKPSDVYVDVPEYVQVATISATGQTEYITVEQERTYSENALKYGLSLAIRLDTLWPQAINGFTANPLLGTGYATLNKNVVYLFTEADGTDNNFLRTLGETGALGFITFYGLIVLAIVQAGNIIKKNQDDLLTVMAIGYIGGSIGLLLNATYIDVYASSKVAYAFWGMTGILISYATIIEKKNNLTEDFLVRKTKKNNVYKKTSRQITFKNATTPKRRKKKNV